MSDIPARVSAAPSGLLGVLRSWLHARSSEIWPASESSSTTGGPNAHSCGPVHLLVVDDNPVNLMVISALLESRGLAPMMAADGAEAVAIASELRFDLILMDLQMPILDGLGATSAIRRFETDNSRPAVPILAYSASSPGAGVLAMHGFSGSLAKPCGDQELEDCLVQWCPAYRPAPTVRHAHDGNFWQPASRQGGTTRGAPLR